MSKLTGLIACLLLLSLAVGQATTATTNCGASSLPGIASGLIYLGVPTSSVAQTSYSQTLSGFSLGTYDTVFSAFAIAGLQASSTQQYFSLIVDTVTFSNGNTQMNVSLVFTSPNGTFQTTWTKVTLSWVAVSTAFQSMSSTGGSYVWAGSVGISYPFTNGISGPVIPNSLWSQQTAAMGGDLRCGYLNTSPPAFDATCNGATNPGFVTHLYIMGFQFDPTQGSYALAASVLLNGGTNALTDTDESAETFTTRIIGSGSTADLSGPNMLISSVGTQLQYLKIGIVITTILNVAAYPTNNPANFQYAGVYMNYTLFNVAQPIIQTTPRAAGGQNYNYFATLNVKYQIFGLSAFYIASLPSSVTVLDFNVDLTGINTALVSTDDVNYMTGVKISADEWNAVITSCNPSSTNMINIAQKYLTTVPPIQNLQQNIYEVSSLLTFNYFAAGNYFANPANVAAPLTTNVVFTNILYFQNITPGMTYEIDFTLLFPTVPLGATTTSFLVQYSVTVEGNLLINNVANVTANPFVLSPNIFPIRLGYIFKTANPPIQIIINMPRASDTTTVSANALDRTLQTTLTVTQYSLAYNPATDCCVTTCPPNSGINLGYVGNTPANPVTPIIPACVACTAGLIYNSAIGACQCQTGYYSVQQALTGQTQCFPCFAPLCQTCNQATNTVCNSCVTGAAVNSNNLCQCTTGYYQNASLCNPCPYQCGSCSVGTVCATCSDNTTRDSTNNCVCLAGYYDAGVAVCSACPALCQTCSSATNCTSCFTANNRTLVNGQCVCNTGFYQIANTNGSLTCAPCDPSCTACSLLPTQCSNCDPTANRILGYDALGNMVCNCITGYAANSNGQCVQSNCVADPYCATCLTVLGTSTCIKCIAATFRTLVLPQQQCLCQTGYYALNGVCTPCSSGCMSCTSATSCQTCVVSATANGDGSCTCPAGYFFTTNPISYCRKCANYTLTCLGLTQALTCQTNFTVNNGVCSCPTGNYINKLGQCVPCVSGCSNCNSSTTCLVCNQPLYLQSTSCVTRCGPGYYQNGFVCTACSPGCASCQGPNICLICLSNQLAYNGFCYNSCPSGSVASNASTCVSCNAPCATCTQEPSKCTSCSSCCGSLFNFQCLTSCPVGTYSINGTCQYCAFSCSSCLGSNTTCTACPTGKILYNGACYAQCPYVMIGGICTFNCANGLYKTAINQCASCDSGCATCSVNPKNCTTCPAGKGYALNGSCVQTCPTNYFGLNGVCTACNSECNGCTTTCSNCINCAPGYYKCGSACVKTCNPNQYADNQGGLCVTCNQQCQTCSSLNFCTTCANPQAVPVNGICNDCSYPCNTCSTTNPSACTTCVKGFNLIGSTCIAACPTGATPSNGVCVCASGFIYSNQCVASCPTGYGAIGGQCTQCGSNCASCSGSASTCTACVNGYSLNQVTGVCQVAPSCTYGQYYSQSSATCTSICPTGYFFYENVCLTACLSGYADNGVGGCVAVTPATGCSYPNYLSNGICITTCPSGTYPNTQTRVCQSCSSNCFSCLTNTFCYACNAGYSLSNGVCITATISCAAGQFQYNGVCYTTCPQGTCAQGNFCQRTCPAGTWSYNQGCYKNCPTNYTTPDACVDACPAGTSLVNNVCQVVSQSCPSGQYWDGTSSSCLACQYPCSQCSLRASYCTACSSGLTLSQNLCVSASNSCGSNSYQSLSGQCQTCPAKCATCLSATICSSCATGYNFNGNDCVLALAQLNNVNLTISSVTKRGNTAYITVCPNIVPNGLSPQQQGSFFTVVPAAADQGNIAYINQWLSTVNPGCVTVGVNYNAFPAQSAVFLAVNAQILASSYLSIGYTASASSFVSASININLPATPANVVPPSNAINVPSDSQASIPQQVNAAFQSANANSLN